MAVHSAKFDVRDSDVETQIANEEPSGTINDRGVVKEGNSHVRVFWFYDEA